MFDAAREDGPDGPFLLYFDGVLTFAEVDERANALAKLLVDNGFGRGDRLAILTQNNPAFVVALIAAWKVGGIGVPINPMNTARELTFALIDTGATALVCLDSLYDEVARPVVESGETDVEVVVTTSVDDWREPTPGSSPLVDYPALIDLPTAQETFSATPAPGDPAVLMYTSGTTGMPKATVNTHANVTAGAEVYRRWFNLTTDDVVLGVSPMFHITGLIAHLSVALRLGAPLVLTHRFTAAEVLAAIAQHCPTFVVATISALVALVDESKSVADFASLRTIASGGAAVSPSVADKITDGMGRPLTIVYGLTETTSPALAVPVGRTAPVDPESGTLSIGIPVYDTTVRIVADDGGDVPAGESGELIITGPQVAAGYWRQPDVEELSGESELRTGDVGFVDAAGWYFLIDRKKDMISSAGYKVWPREVEEVLYRHPDVAEVAVVGVPDELRGESVTAFVVLEPGRTTSVDELMDYARKQLAAFKRPRRLVLIDALPKTSTGKILRRALRQE